GRPSTAPSNQRNQYAAFERLFRGSLTLFLNSLNLQNLQNPHGVRGRRLGRRLRLRRAFSGKRKEKGGSSPSRPPDSVTIVSFLTTSESVTLCGPRASASTNPTEVSMLIGDVVEVIGRARINYVIRSLEASPTGIPMARLSRIDEAEGLVTSVAMLTLSAG